MSKTIKKIWNWVSGILVGIVVLLAVALVGVRVVGLQPYVVLSGSMEPVYASTDYAATFMVYQAEMADAPSATVNTSGNVIQSGSGTGITRTFSAGKTDTVVFTNQYRKHLGQLTITKTVEGTPAETDTFIFHVTGNGIDMDVTITGSGSVTIYDLPLGEYTITEDTDWNWRYTPKSSTANATVTLDNTSTANATVTLDNTSAAVSFTNTYKEENPWLNFVTNILNIFTKEGGTVEDE